LDIQICKLNKYSFINVCNWALESSVNTFWLWGMENIEHSWWGELVDAIQNAKEKNNGILALRKLDIFDCTQKMSKEMQMKIVQCGVKLRIDNRRVKLPLQSDSSSSSNSSLSESSSSESLDDAERDPQYNQRPPLPPPALPWISTSPSHTSTRPPQAAYPLAHDRPRIRARRKIHQRAARKSSTATSSSISSLSTASQALGLPNLFVAQKESSSMSSYSDADRAPSSSIDVGEADENMLKDLCAGQSQLLHSSIIIAYNAKYNSPKYNPTCKVTQLSF